MTTIKQKAKTEFGSAEADIRDKTVFRINDQRLEERLLREVNQTLEKTMYICRAAEAEKAQIQAMVEQNITVQAIEKKTRDIKPNKRYEKTSQQQKANADSFMYKKCGKLHLPRQCPAFGATCHACGKHNHFATMCKSEQKEAQPKHK